MATKTIARRRRARPSLKSLSSGSEVVGEVGVGKGKGGERVTVVGGVMVVSVEMECCCC